MIKSLFSSIITLSWPRSLRSYLNGRNSAWKWPRWRPDGDVAVRSFHFLYRFIILSIVISIFRSGLDVWNCSSRRLLAGSVVMASRLAVPARIAFAIGVVAPHPIVSQTSSTANGVSSA